MFIMIAAMFSFSCKTTKLDKQGKVIETANARHIKKIHPHGFWTGKGYVNIETTKTITIK